VAIWIVADDDVSEEGCIVVRCGNNFEPLLPRQDLRTYVLPMSWGSPGQGTLALALAMLAYCLPDYGLALALHVVFAEEVLMGLPAGGWAIETHQIIRWCAEQVADQPNPAFKLYFTQPWGGR
jgi:hypothetical protein